jgi:hypothetical protein
LAEGVDEGRDIVAEQSQREVPVETPPTDEIVLKETLETDHFSVGNQEIAEASYNTDYAAVQHEATEYDPHVVGKSHYLSDPLKATARVLPDIVAARVRRKVETSKPRMY